MFKSNGDNKLLDILHSGSNGDLSQKNIDKEHLTDMIKDQNNNEKTNRSNSTSGNITETIYEGAEIISNIASSNNLTSNSTNKIITQDGALSNNVTGENIVKVEENNKSSSNNKYASNEITPLQIKEALTIGNDDNSLEIKNLLRGTTLDLPSKSLLNRFNRFSRFGYLDPYSEMISGTREYLFFSKPDLHIFDNDGNLNSELSGIPFFKEAITNYKYSAYCLQQFFGGSSKLSSNSSVGTSNGSLFNIQSKYNFILSNHVTSTLDLPTISAEEQQNNQTLWGDNTSYREGSCKSDTQADFTLEFKDTKYLDVYMIFKIYDEYIRAKYITNITPNRKIYIEKKINPEPFSIWKVIIDDTGRIMYWAKAIACTPMSVPRDTLSNIENNIKFSINFKAQFIEEMDPVHLQEINYLTMTSMGKSGNNLTYNKILDSLNHWKFALDTYNSISKDNKKYTYVSGGDTWVSYPFIIKNERSFSRTGDIGKSSGSFYRLGWLTK